MNTIGVMAMPPDFKYRKTHQLGRPCHEKYSTFWCRHPAMSTQHRAKIFTSFDALKGFDEAIASKELPYMDKKDIDEDMLNQKLQKLAEYNGVVAITCFCPCTDPMNHAYENRQGLYETVVGTFWNMDIAARTIRVADKVIHFDNIADIMFCSSSPDTNLDNRNE